MIEPLINAAKSVLDSRPELLNLMWVFVAGSCVALLRSLVDGTRRSAGRLTAACIFGGIGAIIADRMFVNSDWHVFYVGVGAVIAENLILGLWRASEQFRDDPIAVFKDLWKLMVPGLKDIGDYQKTRKELRDDEDDRDGKA